MFNKNREQAKEMRDVCESACVFVWVFRACIICSLCSFHIGTGIPFHPIPFHSIPYVALSNAFASKSSRSIGGSGTSPPLPNTCTCGICVFCVWMGLCTLLHNKDFILYQCAAFGWWLKWTDTNTNTHIYASYCVHFNRKESEKRR